MSIEIIFAIIVLVLIAVATVAYVTTERVLHEYYRKLPGYRPLRDTALDY